MEDCREFVIPVIKGQEIRQFRNFINDLFGVKVEFTTDLRSAQRTSNEWVKVTGLAERRQKAEVYIKNISNPEITSIFNIPEDIISSGSWDQHLIYYVQQNCLAFVRPLSPTQLLLQGSQLAVTQAVSMFEQYISRRMPSIAPSATMAYASQNPVYCAQPSMQYYQHQHRQGGMPFERPEGRSVYRSQDIACKGSELMPRTNLADAFQPGVENQVTAKGAVLRSRYEHPSESLGQYQTRQKMNESILRDFAQKLDYTDEEINTAMAKFSASGNNQALDENSLLQHLIQLYPRKKPSFTCNTDSRVVRDSAPSIAPTQNQINVKEVLNSDEKEQLKKNDSPNSCLRHIVVDGSNVAMSHGSKDVFSCKGIQICVDYFKQRGHKEITVFVPQWRKEASKPDRPIEDQQILLELEDEQILSFTPSRRVNGQRVVCYDDRYIVKLAADNDGIIVSNDNFRDLIKENPEWKKVIEERLLMYTFVKDVFMPPDDPLGRRGPKLGAFLRKGTQANPRLCPYMKKCTYGSKCKYYHPEKTSNDSSNKEKQADSQSLQNGNLPTNFGVTDQAPIVAFNQKKPQSMDGRFQKETQQGSSLVNSSHTDQVKAKAEGNTAQKSTQHDANALRLQLEEILPAMKEKIKQVIESNPNENNLDTLCNMVLQ